MKNKYRNAMAFSASVMLVLILSILSVGCAKNNVYDTDSVGSVSYPFTFEPLLSDDITQSPDTAETTTEAITTTETLPIETVYENAVKEYLTPLDSFSWERTYSPEIVMIHFTSAVVINKNDPYNIDLIRDIFIDSEVSIHYIIDRNGIIRCYIPEERVAWHAGKGEFLEDPKYTNAMNHYSVGIELVGMGSREDMSGYIKGEVYDSLDDSLKCFTDAQYKSLKLLVEDICARYSIPLDRDHIIGHEEYSPKKKDPGDLFEWNRIVPEK